MSDKLRSLADALPAEIARCQELLEAYTAIGPVGAFGHAAITKDIDDALKALASGDAVAMLSAYTALRRCE